ncbi:conserved hypothetical protein [Neospora caninum Liverpool]|uniref:Transmembrane protein n=1 Tax=Neospora caninum (strain Liverpool) TaxID=572307 RepID=F0VQR8_NEOCL|nr:conserved hypothetical protein [Neospora caninum Liverpool]CBZ56065.1 conserved hypothetical protein [Neospora caninum Liverpool]CEL70813.1 TPA: hypothetical protein BN1204_064910 [Neospora caninum Liverpool]|eukprot:XP_003886091.1 conserved hypothetical protein [Neospora caninum Liverpool]
MHSAFLRTSLPSSRGPNRGRRVAFLSALPSTCGKAASTRGSPSGSQPAFSLFGSRASPPSRSASANGAPVQLAAAASSVPSFVFSSFSSPILSGWRPATPFPALSLLSPLLPLGRTVEETVSSSREGTAGRETFLFAQTPGALGADEEGPLPTLTLTQADLDFYRELGVSPKAPWWEVQQAYQLKHSEVEDETQQRKMEEAWLQIFAKRFNRDFLDVCRRYENQHTEESRSRLSKFFAWVFGRRKPASNDIDWDSGFPSEEDPVYMSQVDAPREIKEIMMGLGDRSGVFRDIAKDDDKRRDGLFRRFDIARVWSTGSFFVPLALVSLSSSKLITPALTTAFGLSASFMGKIDTNMGTEGASELKRFSPPTLRTLLWTGGLLLLHAVLGVAGASALLTAIGRLPLGLRPESLVAAMVILQWWFSAVAYRTHESVPVDDDLGDDLDDDPDASEGTRPNMPQDDSDEDSDGDDLSGPLDE